MHSILRFLVVVGMIFGTLLLWHSDQESVASNAKGSLKSVEEELSHSLRALPALASDKNWSEENFSEELSDAFSRNDPCSVLALLKGADSVAPQRVWAAGMRVLFRRTSVTDPLLLDFFTKEGSPLLGGVEAGTAPQWRFFQALALSRQLSSELFLHKKNLDSALELLKGLVAEDPENGAYQYFLGQTLRALGAAKDDVHAAFQAASKAPKFDLFYQGIYDKLLETSYRNSASFTWVYAYLKVAPLPDFNEGLRYIRYWASIEENGKWVANRISKRFMDLGSQYKATSPGYLYSHAEYIQGQQLRLAVDGKMEKDWAAYTERMREAKDFISESPKVLGAAESALFQGLLRGEEKQECNWLNWKELFEVYRAKKRS